MYNGVHLILQGIYGNGNKEKNNFFQKKDTKNCLR